jgi:hypothetical protein
MRGRRKQRGSALEAKPKILFSTAHTHMLLSSALVWSRKTIASFPPIHTLRRSSPGRRALRTYSELGNTTGFSSATAWSEDEGACNVTGRPTKRARGFCFDSEIGTARRYHNCVRGMDRLIDYLQTERVQYVWI